MTEETIRPVLALLSSGPIDTDFGEFNMSVFHDGDQQAVVLSLGVLHGQENVLCRVHSECISAHVFLSKQCDCRTQMIDAQERIQKEGQGLIIFLEQEGRGHGAAAHVSTLELKRRGIPQDEAYGLRGFHGDARHYDITAKIIKFWEINSIILMSSSKTKKEALENLGVVIKNMKGHSNLILLEKGLNNLEYYINAGQAIPIWKSNGMRIFIIGDLMVDYNFTISIGFVA